LIGFKKNAIDVEGIFRISGEHAPTKEFRESFDYEDEIILKTDDPHIISSALKLYLREVDNPLITRELFNDFIAAAEMPENDAIDKIKILCEKLPNEHKWILIYLCSLLNEIRKKEEVNLMSLKNIVIVFGPSIMKNPDPAGEMDFELISQQSKLLTVVLEKFNQIFGEKAVETVLNEYNIFCEETKVDIEPQRIEKSKSQPNIQEDNPESKTDDDEPDSKKKKSKPLTGRLKSKKEKNGDDKKKEKIVDDKKKKKFKKFRKGWKKK